MTQSLVDPVNDEAVPKVDDAVSVGEDLAFQERWWKFERVIWSCFLLILLADVLGVFGRGWLARAEQRVPGSGLHVKYEHVARASTPSMMTIEVGPDAVDHGALHLFVTESLVRELGTQRIIPQPESSVIGHGGITYTFPASEMPATVQLEMNSSFPGVHAWTLQVPGHAAVGGHTVVVP